ncbi:CIC11C00000004024 [Sungouiella intermedia]|uniref:2-dehydropantoate 2-reductase n=1 Tax=Sungouiella intermedia TaxID=45354 RepID=A0A1L0G0K6_9ASCO|nr:CIC11C00000004024 [[Candida] intermedia]
MSVYVLGAGAMGSLVAHELALGGKLAPTLLLKSRRRLEAFHNENSTISVVRPLGSESVSSKVKLNALVGPPVGKDGKIGHIDNLIISTKTYATFHALQPYLANISKDTNVLILQNGMGMVPALRKRFWSEPHHVPNIYQAISTHGAYKLTPTSIHHVGLGSLAISHIPDSSSPEKSATEHPQLIQAVLDASALNATYKPYDEFLLIQMEKLVVNACINPLTAVLDCFNGELLNGKHIVQMMKRVVKECVDCFREEYPQLDDIPTSSTYLDYDRLLATVLEICKLTSQNSSSMREDLRSLNTTEIDWINGYIVGLGYKHRIPTPMNKTLVNLVTTKLSIERSRESLALEKSVF